MALRNPAPRLACAAALALAAVGFSRPGPTLREAGDASEEWFRAQRAFPAREIPGNVLERASAALTAAVATRPKLALSGDTWISIGPQPINDPGTRSAWAGRV